MWAAAAQVPVAWVSLDAGDNNPSRFWSYLLVALDTLLPGPRAPRHRKAHKTQTRFPETARSMLMNTLSAISSPIALVLDDYHLLTGDNRPLHEAVALLLDHLAPHVHIVLSSRSDPPLPLPRLRAHGLLLELRAADLRFTPAEAAAFFHTRLGQVLPQETLETLYARAEGWATGLQLAIILAQHQGIAQAAATFNGKNR